MLASNRLHGALSDAIGILFLPPTLMPRNSAIQRVCNAFTPIDDKVRGRKLAGDQRDRATPMSFHAISVWGTARLLVQLSAQ